MPGIPACCEKVTEALALVLASDAVPFGGSGLDTSVGVVESKLGAILRRLCCLRAFPCAIVTDVIGTICEAASAFAEENVPPTITGVPLAKSAIPRRLSTNVWFVIVIVNVAGTPTLVEVK